MIMERIDGKVNYEKEFGSKGIEFRIEFKWF